MNIGESIREIRKAKKIKLKDFADKCDLSHTAVYNIESGRTFPTQPTIEAMAKALKVSIGQILFCSLKEEDIPEEVRASFIPMYNYLKSALIK